MAPILSNVLPRVLIVSRRTVRKNKFVDFVGEYHLDLLVSYGAAPVIVPRVNGVHTLLDSFEPIHGVLLCEGEDIDPSLYNSGTSEFSPEELEEIRRSYASDTAIDREKDSIEFKLVNLCLDRNIPFLGICRGSQVLNVACGGTLYQDIEREVNPRNDQARVVHMDYENYDGHRHLIKVVKGTPLNHWFKDSMNSEMEISVNSYHHQGVRRLARRFVPMAFAPDGLVEGFYDPDAYCPEEGKFIMGLQFHPERMRREDSDEFDYPGCSFAYHEFVTAVKAYGRKLSGLGSRRSIPRSFSLTKIVYSVGTRVLMKESGLEAGAEFLQENAVLSLQQEKRLKQMGATVRNSSVYMQKLKMNEDRDNVAKAIIQKMSTEKLSELVSFYQKMGQICSEALEIKLRTPLV